MDVEDEQDENLEIDHHHSDTGGSQVERKNELNASLRSPAASCDVEKTTPPPKDELVSRRTDDVISGRIKSRNGSSENGTSANRRKKHRRGKSKKRKWKPYNKLTWEEKRELEDRETRRAHRIREERFSLYGQPVAPYNTTQFLMEDHNVQEPEFKQQQQHHKSSVSESAAAADDATTKSDEYYYSSPSDEEEFLQKEFDSIYDNIHAERLSSMSKIELIQEYTLLEERMEKLEQRLRKSDSNFVGRADDPSGSTDLSCWDPNDPSAEAIEKIRIFKQEIRKLMDENSKLRRENELLRCGRNRVKRPGASCNFSPRVSPTSSGETEVAEKPASVDEQP